MAEFDTVEDTKQCLLHEACHAINGGGHELPFWTELRLLINQYMGEDVPFNEHQQKMMNDYLDRN